MNIQPTIAFNTNLPVTANKDDAALKKACGEFESLLVAQILHKMRDTVPKSDLFGSREKEAIFQSMLDDETAKQLSNSGTLGIADLLYQQLKGAETAKVPDGSVDK
ncbi:MAG: rod-binding protein [Armatimonadota bacterium]|nr:rod-binding protein [Armatimonadota bacterium]